MEHGAGASHKHLGRSQRNTAEHGTHHTGFMSMNPKMFPPTEIFWGLKGCNSIIRFKDSRKTCLSVWVGAKPRG